MKCFACPRKCGRDREKEIGFCGEGNQIRVAKIIHNFKWEEPPISKEKGTCAIFFSGCNLRCSYCQNYTISRGGRGSLYTIEEFAELLKKIDDSESETIDLITPTHFVDQLLEVFKIYKPKKKVIYNSSGYELEEQIEKIAPYVDIFLPDFKYADNNLAEQFSCCKNYFEVASKAVLKMCKLKSNVFKDGCLEQGVLIRHLVLPNQVQNSLRVFDFIKENIKNPYISIMSQFTPNGEMKEGRRILPLEYKLVLNHLKKIGLNDGFMQDMDAADEEYIPNFLDE